eukprot:3984518-Pyramimonas_sp.AAC.1
MARAAFATASSRDSVSGSFERAYMYFCPNVVSNFGGPLSAARQPDRFGSFVSACWKYALNF